MSLRHLLQSAAVLLTCATAGQAQSASAAPVKPLFTWQDGLLGWVFVAGTFGTHPLDRYVAKRLQTPRAQENRFLQRSATAVRTIADPGSYIIGGSLYAIGRLSKDKEMAALGLHGTEALLIGEGFASVLKDAFGRARPFLSANDPKPNDWQFLRGFKGDDSYRSFPSGHSVAAFAAAAAVTSETAGWWPAWRWVIGTTMYGGASLVGVSRMYNNRHWASDVIMGAAIGTFAGTKVVRYHNIHPNTGVDRWLLKASMSVDPGEHSLHLSLLPAPALFRDTPRLHR